MDISYERFTPDSEPSLQISELAEGFALAQIPEDISDRSKHVLRFKEGIVNEILNNDTFIAKHNGEIIGMLRFIRLPIKHNGKPTFEIGRGFVKAEFREKKIYSKLKQNALKTFAEDNPDSFIVSNTKNGHLIDSLQRSGWTEYDYRHYLTLHNFPQEEGQVCESHGYRTFIISTEQILSSETT